MPTDQPTLDSSVVDLPDFQRQVALGDTAGDGATMAANASHESLPAGAAVPLAAVGATTAVGIGYIFLRH